MYLSDPQALYEAVSPAGRRPLNQMILAKLKIDSDEHGVFVAGDELNEPFADAVTVFRRTQAGSTMDIASDAAGQPAARPAYLRRVAQLERWDDVDAAWASFIANGPPSSQALGAPS